MKATAPTRRAKTSPKLSVGLLALGLIALLPSLALAKKSDRDQPMTYDAKYTEAFNAPNTISTLKGNVKVVQGTMVLTGDLAKIYLDADQQIARVVVTGNPAHIQQLDENNNLMQGDALTLDYDNINGIAVLITNAVVRQQGRGEFHGDKLTYNTDTSLITGEAGGEGLVHGVILPKPKPGAPAAAAKPATPATPATPPATPPAGKPEGK
ncbi:lipopolysaccharide transport periplasmic protein LptA [Dyella solisilvae]|uniref:Lipopolysaccharide transport periplasmic protein LptA n=1 Tax=Dyella solisilvae TaxID=1920168 RepID=A0A370K4S0_9GAMM|nr:lipopolysaccharide transport periplasmic protein LptA [Dyella solisilvae]RDI97661.1 lipopolysaccharide transport periplasmic protein LptA [Dyella solisilvae]